jgi:integrase
MWQQQHGQHLRDGERRHRHLLTMCEALGNPVARLLTPDRYLKFRQARASKGINPKTLNNELGYLNAVYNGLHKTGQINYGNPLSPIQPIKLSERELSFLTGEQISELLKTMQLNSENLHVLLITKLSLATGCRWSEAEKMHIRQIGNQRVTFVDTKSGKNRTVPISQNLEHELRAHEKQRGINGKLFTGLIGAFRRALARTSIQLPKGQAAHVLRHTVASHVIMNSGDILTLQKIFGHRSIVITMQYSHLSPNHLNDAVKLAPKVA